MTTVLTTPRLCRRLWSDSDVDAQHLVDRNANAAVTRDIGEGPVDLDPGTLLRPPRCASSPRSDWPC
jgi:hypothetical protein